MTDTPAFDFSLLAQGNIPVTDVASGDRVFLEGDAGDAMYLVVEGKVSIKTGGMIVESVGPGTIFGEMSLIDGSPRSATAIAAEDSKLATIDQNSFLGLVQRSPEFALQVMQLMAKRIRRTNESL